MSVGFNPDLQPTISMGVMLQGSLQASSAAAFHLTT